MLMAKKTYGIVIITRKVICSHSSLIVLLFTGWPQLNLIGNSRNLMLLSTRRKRFFFGNVLLLLLQSNGLTTSIDTNGNDFYYLPNIQFICKKIRMLLCWFFLFLPRNKMRWMKSGFILMIIIFVTVNQLMYNFLWRRERFVQHSDYCHLRTFCERISVWKSVQATFFFVIICKKPFLVTNKRAFGLQRRYNSKWKYLCAKEVTNNNINVCNHKWVPFGLLDWKSLDLSS